jgi:hypothetical protein
MLMFLKDQILNELDALLAEGQRLDDSFRSSGMGHESPIPEYEHRAFVTSALSAISRIAGKDSQYYELAPKPSTESRIRVAGHSPTIIPGLRGALTSLRAAVEADSLVSLVNRIRVAIHDDLLEQARELLDSGYYVAAMVLIGGVLENHLRKMCEARSLDWSGKGSISKYNNLLRNEVYNQAVWRRIQSIGDVRNEAAHGNADQVGESDVKDALNFAIRLLIDYPQ